MDWNLLGNFVHGLVYFTLTLAVAFLSSRSHRILLARRLSWLGIFAACEALFAWGSLFPHLSPGEVAPILITLRVAILALGYTFLAAFGIQAFRAETFSSSSARRLLIGINALWVLPYGVGLSITFPGWTATVTTAETIVRYLVAFPASIVTAFGLRRQSYQSLDPSIRRRIQFPLRLCEISLLVLGVFNLALLPSAPVWRWMQVPRDVIARAPLEWLWIANGVALTLGWGRSLTAIQRAIEEWVEGVERLQALTADRERIGRDLHDGIIQSIYAAGLLLESIIPVIPGEPERAQSQVGRVLDSLNHVIQDIRRYIFDLRSDIADEDVPTGIERLLRDFRVNTLLETELEIVGEPVSIASVERRRHILQIVREALANTARHASARWVKVQLRYNEASLDLTVSDDGVGMQALLIGKGYGLRNIRERARLLDGVLRIESAPNEGVTFHLAVPY